MSETEFSKIFAKNIAYYLSINNMLQVDLARKLGVSESTVSRWLDATKTPRMGTIEKICSILNINKSDLLIDHETPEYEQYYVQSETQRIAAKIAQDSELKLLFDAAQDASPEDLMTVHTMLKALKDKEERRYDD